MPFTQLKKISCFPGNAVRGNQVRLGSRFKFNGIGLSHHIILTLITALIVEPSIS